MSENILNLNFINKRKKELGYTNEKLSKLSGVPKSTIDKIFAGFAQNPQITTLKMIAKALQCTLDDLMDIPIKNEITLKSDEHNIIQRYRTLNKQGKDKIKEYISDIAENKKYTAFEPDEAHKRIIAEIKKLNA